MGEFDALPSRAGIPPAAMSEADMILPLFSSLSIPYMGPTSMFHSQGYAPWHFGVPPALQTMDVAALFPGHQTMPSSPVASEALFGGSGSAKLQPLMSGSPKLSSMLGSTIDVSR